jgi:hypothetical protein
MRCGSTEHTSDECTRIPPQMGMSDQERAYSMEVSQDAKAMILLIVSVIAALMIFAALEVTP